VKEVSVKTDDHNTNNNNSNDNLNLSAINYCHS